MGLVRLVGLHTIRTCPFTPTRKHRYITLSKPNYDYTKTLVKVNVSELDPNVKQ